MMSIKANVKYAYEGIEVGGPRHLYRTNLVLRFLEGAHIKGRVLDAGCGDGCVSLELAKRGWEVYALDYSSDALNILKKRLAASNLTKYVKIYHKNLESLDSPNSFFDAIVCGEVLEHLEDDCKIMSLFNRILRPDGVCVVSVPVISKGWDKWDDFVGHHRLYSLESFKKIVESSGFLLEKYIFWGFPLAKIHHLVYLNWFKQTKNYEEKQKNIVARIVKSKLISFFGAKIFRFDEIFGHWQRGVGLVARLRKK